MYFIDKALRKKRGIMICCVNNFQGPEVLKGGSADDKSSKSIVTPDRNLHFSKFQLRILNLQTRLRTICQIQTVCAISIFVKKIIIIINNNNNK